MRKFAPQKKFTSQITVKNLPHQITYFNSSFHEVLLKSFRNAWTYAPMQPHKIDHDLSEFILLEHLSFIIVGHHHWYQTYHLIKTMIQPPPPQKIPPSICWTWEILPPILPLKLPGLGRAILCLGKKHCRGSVACVCFFFWLGKQLPTNYPTVFFWKKCPTRPTIRVPAFLGLSFLVAT